MRTPGTTSTPGLDRADRMGMYGSIAIVAVGAVIAVRAAIERLLEVGDGTDVPVTVPLQDEWADLPLGPDGAPLTAAVDSATVTVPDPAPATLFALYAQPIWTALLVLAAVTFAALFFLRLARGRAFERGTSRLVYTAAFVLLGGWWAAVILDNMTVNGALSAISDYTYEGITFGVNLLPFLAFLVVGAMAAALQIGERLQRETEGLV